MPKPAQFSKSKVSNLFRHRGGNFYAVAKISGKVIRRSLETEYFNTAKIKLPAVLKEIEEAKSASEAWTLRKAMHDEAHITHLGPRLDQQVRIW